MSFTISIDNEIKNIKKRDDILFYDGINILCGVNGSGKTNFLELISTNQIRNSYQQTQISYINVSEISSTISNVYNSSNYHQPKQLNKLIDLPNILSYLTSFIETSSQLASTTKIDDYISHFKEQNHINAHLNNEFMITVDYLNYLIKRSENILDIEVLKRQSLFDDYSRTGRVHKLFESPVSNKFAEKCIAYYKLKSFLALQEHENSKLQHQTYDEQRVESNLVSIYGKEIAPYEELNSCFEKYGFNSRLIPPRNDDMYALRFKIMGTEREIDFNDLSTGEKIIVMIMTFITFERNQIKLLLIDELDAYLNPQMSNMLITILRDFVVGKLQIDVLMTTHNPITVNYMLEEKEHVFWMEKGKISESKKINVLQLLTPGMFTFNQQGLETIFNIPGKECLIFTEGHTDTVHIEAAISVLKPSILNKIKFIDFGKGNSNAESVRILVEKLSLIQNISLPKIIGIFDRDNEGKKHYETLKSNKNFVEAANNLYLTFNSSFAIILNANNINRFKDNYTPVELLYSESFLTQNSVITVIKDNASKEKIQNKYIDGKIIYKTAINSESPHDVYLVDDDKKNDFANYVKQNYSSLNDEFCGFKILVDTIERILSTS